MNNKPNHSDDKPKDPSDQYHLANKYYYGDGVNQDYTTAVEWYTKSAEQGNEMAQLHLGWMYESGEGIEKNYVKAVEWYTKSAKQGYARAQTNLGCMYERGDGVDQDYTTALEWYQKAAEQGNKYAQNKLGCMYENGEGIEKNYVKAVEWYQKAAEQGHANAQYKLGWMYKNGKGIEKNYIKAVEWYKKAAEQGYANAQNSLGVNYYYGKGIEKNYRKAFKWFKQAASQEQVYAYYNLAYMYYKGKGVIGDNDKALHWYNKALRQDPGYKKEPHYFVSRLSVLNANETIKKLKMLTNNAHNDNKIKRLITHVQFPTTHEETEQYREHGLTELRRLLLEGLENEKTEHSLIDNVLPIVKTLTRYGCKLDISTLIDLAKSNYKSNDYIWQEILDQFNAETPNSLMILEGLNNSTLDQFLCVAYLDFANYQFIYNTVNVKHPFNSKYGIERLTEYLNEDSDYPDSYAKSATAALPFICKPEQGSLMNLAKGYPTGDIAVQLCWVLVKTGDRDAGIHQLQQWAMDCRYSGIACKMLTELGFCDKIPDQCHEDEFKALSELSSWLEHPCEYNEVPEKLEIMDQKTLYWPPTHDTRTMYVIRYEYSSYNTIGIGMVGSSTFSVRCFEDELVNWPLIDIYGLYCAFELCMNKDSRAPENYSSKSSVSHGVKLLKQYNSTF
jgi:TPR repeat protein